MARRVITRATLAGGCVGESGIWIPGAAAPRQQCGETGSDHIGPLIASQAELNVHRLAGFHQVYGGWSGHPPKEYGFTIGRAEEPMFKVNVCAAGHCGSPAAWRMVGAVVFLSLASVLSWTGTRALGRHLRFDAALTAGHQLVRTGPYRIVRHPIYTSMFCLLLGTGFVIASVPLLLAATVIFIGGTEIRVRIEDGLLASRFGAEFREYRRTVSAYVPLIR